MPALALFGLAICLGLAGMLRAQAAEPVARAGELRIIDLPLPPAAEIALQTGIKASPEVIHQQLKESKEQLVAALGLRVVQDFDHLPMLIVEMGSDIEQAAMVESPSIVKIWKIPELRTQEVTATQSANQLQANLAQMAGMDGSGTSVLVTDGAEDPGPPLDIHPDFGNCTGVGQAPGCQLWTWQSYVPAGFTRHGINVAAIVARTARGAGIHFADVGFNTEDGKDRIDYSSAFSALNWAVQNQQAYNIVAHNMSWGSLPVESDCSPGLFSFQVARSVGIAQIAASGNITQEDPTPGWVWPACSPVVISVGAIDSTGQNWPVTSFSKSDSNMTFLAPGFLINAGGYTQTGTSMASPHVAGAYAVLQSAAAWNKSLGENELVAYMRERGVWITDTRNGGQVSFPVPQIFNTRPVRLNVSNRFEAEYSLITPPRAECGPNCFRFLPNDPVSLQISNPGIIALHCSSFGNTCGTVMDRQRTITLMPRASLAAAMAVISGRVEATPLAELIFWNGFE